MTEICVSADVETKEGVPDPRVIPSLSDTEYYDLLKGGLYVIYNAINNKFYVGSTVDFNKRWILHRHHLRKGTHHSPLLQEEWNTYGENAFRFNCIQGIKDRKQRLELEQHFLNTLTPAYNVCPDATSCKGIKRSKDTLAKMKLAANLPHRIESIRRIASQPKSDTHKENISKSRLGIRPSEETRAKMRDASKKRWAKPEEREKIRQARLKQAAPKKTQSPSGDQSEGGGL